MLTSVEKYVLTFTLCLLGVREYRGVCMCILDTPLRECMTSLFKHASFWVNIDKIHVNPCSLCLSLSLYFKFKCWEFVVKYFPSFKYYPDKNNSTALFMAYYSITITIFQILQFVHPVFLLHNHIPLLSFFRMNNHIA